MFTTAWAQRPLKQDLMIVSLCEPWRIAWMLPPQRFVSLWVMGLELMIPHWFICRASHSESLRSSTEHTFRGCLLQKGPVVHSSPLSALYGEGNSTSGPERAAGRYKKSCWLVFRSSPTSGNHSCYMKSFFTWSSSSILPHAVSFVTLFLFSPPNQ